jgi:hypothetical protein
MVALEVMQQLLFGDEDCLDQFLKLHVAYLGVEEDLAHEVYKPLDLAVVPGIVVDTHYGPFLTINLIKK